MVSSAKLKPRRCLIAAVCLAICFGFFPCAYSSAAPADDVPSITVALYPYVPDIELMKNIILDEWESIDPDRALKFVEWDCYSGSPPDHIDVFMYDAVFLHYFIDSGHVAEIGFEDIDDPEGIMPFAMRDLRINGKYYGIPNLLCAYFLIYYKDDAEVAHANNIYELYDIMGERQNEGLVLNFRDNYPYYYLDAVMDMRQEYTSFETAPTFTESNLEAIKPLELFIKMAGSEHIWEANTEAQSYDPFGLARRFNNGEGRCCFSFSEDMAFMDNIIDDIGVKTISMSKTDNIQVFFADIVSINASVTDDDKLENCKKLINIMSSERFLEKLTIGNGTPPYLLPARASIYTKASDEYPLYDRLYELAANQSNHVLKYMGDIYDYQDKAYQTLSEMLQ